MADVFTSRHNGWLFSVCAATLVFAAHPALAGERRIEVWNRTHQTMVRLYVDAPAWGEPSEDLLGNSTLPPGSSFRLRLDDELGDYCVTDFHARFEDGTEVRRPKIDVCQTPTLEFRD